MEFTIENLKAMAYDEIAKIEQAQANLKEINNLIARKNLEQTSVSPEQFAEEEKEEKQN